MKKSTLLGLGLALIASSAFASNTGFKLNYPIIQTPGGGSSNNWISLPYFYFANGNVGQTGQNALDLCFDLNGAASNNSKVTSVIRFDTANDLPMQQSCIGKTSLFNLKVGEGYSVKPAAASVVIDIVGSHDDTYAPNKGGTQLYQIIQTPGGGSSNNWFSVPYHSKANNALDACAAFNGAPNNNSKVTSFIRFDTANDLPMQQSCIGKTSLFDLKPGEGYSVKPAQAAGIGISMDVY